MLTQLLHANNDHCFASSATIYVPLRMTQRLLPFFPLRNSVRSASISFATDSSLDHVTLVAQLKPMAYFTRVLFVSLQVLLPVVLFCFCFCVTDHRPTIHHHGRVRLLVVGCRFVVCRSSSWQCREFVVVLCASLLLAATAHSPTATAPRTQPHTPTRSLCSIEVHSPPLRAHTVLRQIQQY